MAKNVIKSPSPLYPCYCYIVKFQLHGNHHGAVLVEQTDQIERLKGNLNYQKNFFTWLG